MKETPSIEFVLHGKVGGVDITPRTIGLSQFNEFNVQVETFVGGSQRLNLDEAHVEIRETPMFCGCCSQPWFWPALNPI